MSQGAVYCLSDYESVLPRIAALLGATYREGDFDAAEEAFHRSAETARDWVLSGAHGVLTVRLERDEGHFFCRLEAEPLLSRSAGALLEEACRAAGGRPDASPGTRWPAW